MWFVNADLYQKLVARLKLKPRSETAHPLALADVCYAVTSADDAMAIGKQISDTKDISGAAYVPYFTVPNGKRWKLICCSPPNTTANTIVQIYNHYDTQARNYSAAGTTLDPQNLYYMILNAADTIGLSGTGNGADNARTMAMWYQEEDVS